MSAEAIEQEAHAEPIIEALRELDVTEAPPLSDDVKPLIDMWQKPPATFSAQEFTGVLATTRPELYKQLAETITASELPAHLESALSDLSRYSPEHQRSITGAIENYIERFVEQRIGQRITGDQIVEAVRGLIQDPNAYQPFIPMALTYEIANQLQVPLDPYSPEHQQLWMSFPPKTGQGNKV